MTEIIYESKDVIAVNKPPGVIVFRQSENDQKNISLSLLLAVKFPEINGVGGERNGAVHRVDKDTSGVVLFAKNEKALSFLQGQLLEQKAEKRYITLVFKALREDEGEVCTFMTRSPKDRRKQKAYEGVSGKRKAVTFFRVIKRFQEHSLLEVIPKTGRKHQIRCHLSFLGHPIAGDKLYRFKDQKDPEGLERQFLHAKSIKITVPGGEKKIFSAPLPDDLEKILNQLP